MGVSVSLFGPQPIEKLCRGCDSVVILDIGARFLGTEVHRFAGPWA